MAESPFIINVTRENFQQVMETSYEVPVLMDFWADWCQPCKVLMPILAKLAEDYQGKFVLAKLDTEENQDIAARFGIRGIPNVKLFRDGQQVDEFTGALPERAVREFLDKHIVDEAAAAEEEERKLQFFKDQLVDADDAAKLRSRLAANHGDLEALHHLALREAIDGDYEKAMELLLELMRQDRTFDDDAGRRGLLKVFELLGDDPLVGQYRRRMASLLY